MKSKKGIAKADVADHSAGSAFHLETSRREFITGLTGAAVVTALNGTSAAAQGPEGTLNIARVAVPSSFTFTSENKISALNDGFAPANSFDRTHGVYAVRRDLSITSSEPWVSGAYRLRSTRSKFIGPLSIRVQVHCLAAAASKRCLRRRAIESCTGTVAHTYPSTSRRVSAWR